MSGLVELVRGRIVLLGVGFLRPAVLLHSYGPLVLGHAGFGHIVVGHVALGFVVLLDRVQLLPLFLLSSNRKAEHSDCH